MSFWKNWKKPKPIVPASVKPLEKLRLVRLDGPCETSCAICFEWRPCHHWDRDFNDLVCPMCAPHVRDAEINLRAFIVERMNA